MYLGNRQGEFSVHEKFNGRVASLYKSYFYKFGYINMSNFIHIHTLYSRRAIHNLNCLIESNVIKCKQYYWPALIY